MTKSKSSASDPFPAALRLLTRCDRSETELRQKLEQRGYSSSAIDTAISKCREYNYLDDRRYAAERARSMMRSGRGVGPRIMLELRRRGIDETTARQAVEAAESELFTDQVLHDLLSRRFPTFDYATADDRERRRLIGFFQRRGFTLEQIFSLIKETPASRST